MVMNEGQVTCLFVHGWAMNSTIWQPLIEKLPNWINVESVDLPGHGLRINESFTSLDELTKDLQAQCDQYKKDNEPLILVGWSLGALPCLQLCVNDAEEVDALMVVSSNPCFVSRDNWRCGVEALVFDEFAASLKNDFSGTIRRFLSLQVKGSDSGRIVLRDLREKILQQAVPNEVSLDAGLEVLKQVDLRDQLEEITKPVSWVLGGQDGLVKQGLVGELKILMPQAEVELYEKAGHAAFLSHSEEFLQQLISFASTTLKIKHVK
ncbi:MAG: pimeloyl-[acyl-carrier protein] methyl ester esterase [endosymbiont of Galathealinum brachiosum]|uniref:Pimeloyl-[acyl-carrier protein] methyl ester esterase n=1 Tax=endosymbiont of Galathealinum brachiosum TaxID=2200906 RepID=A0A370DDG8_9GAMM|nr:MAG: pimeloyl-[acyl-carrier protein] methyl ester esterase [endosymbiont of Galathealinum brachiosum]